MATRKRGLGRGLDTLIPKVEGDSDHAQGELHELAIDALAPGRYQPRSAIDAEGLDELAQSIRAQGLIQPIIVRRAGKGYEIIAGERRWRAAQLAGLTRVRALVREADDRATIAMALIENIQREDLNPLEEAQALKRLIDEFDLTHQEAADAVGRSRAAVSNLLRLLELPVPIRDLMEAGRLDMGHARALLTLPEAQAIALGEQAASQGWSVRELEQAVREQAGRGGARAKPAAANRDPDIARLEQELAERLCAPVTLRHRSNGRGQLQIRYHSVDELEGILERLRGND